MVADGVAAADIRRIRTQIESSFLFQDETVLDLAMKLARFEAGTPEGFRTLADVLPTYASLTRKELREVAARYLDFDRATVAWAVPAAGRAESARGGGKASKQARKKPARKAAKKPAKKAAKKTAKKPASKAKAGRRKA